MKLLKFGKGNAKLDKRIYTFSIPSGYTCPFAQDCLSKSDRNTGKIKDGKKTKFRCFSASQEALFKNVRQSRWNNFELLRNKSIAEIKEIILSSLPKQAKLVRIHVGGDFFSQDYFDAWLKVAEANPDIIFYAYTKSLRYWTLRVKEIPDNFRLTASYGGSEDHLIAEYGLRFAKVVFSEDEAKAVGLSIDHDDSHAIGNGPSFALLIHGTQPAATPAAKALSTLKKAGNFGYNKSKRVPLAIIGV
jgi:hypothetical protein